MANDTTKVKSDSVYCMPIGDARYVFEDATKKYLQDGVIIELKNKIELEQADKKTQWTNFNKIINAKDKENKVCNERLVNANAISETYKGESDANKQKAKRNGLQRDALIVVIIAGLCLLL